MLPELVILAVHSTSRVHVSALCYAGQKVRQRTAESWAIAFRSLCIVMWIVGEVARDLKLNATFVIEDV